MTGRRKDQQRIAGGCGKRKTGRKRKTGTQNGTALGNAKRDGSEFGKRKTGRNAKRDGSEFVTEIQGNAKRDGSEFVTEIQSRPVLGSRAQSDMVRLLPLM